MTRARFPLHHVRPVLVPMLCIALIGFFAWHAFAGESGLMAWGDYKAERARLAAQAEATARQRGDLEQKVALLGDRAEPDYAEELVRKRLGLVREDEIIVRLQN